MEKILLEPSFWIAVVGLVGFIFWSWNYIAAATLVVGFVRANDRDPQIEKYWSRLNPRNAGYYYLPDITLTRLILTGASAELPSDPLFRLWLNNARWAYFFCILFLSITIVATGLLFHVLKV